MLYIPSNTIYCVSFLGLMGRTRDATSSFGSTFPSQCNVSHFLQYGWLLCATVTAPNAPNRTHNKTRQRAPAIDTWQNGCASGAHEPKPLLVSSLTLLSSNHDNVSLPTAACASRVLRPSTRVATNMCPNPTELGLVPRQFKTQQCAI